MFLALNGLLFYGVFLITTAGLGLAERHVASGVRMSISLLVAMSHPSTKYKVGCRFFCRFMRRFVYRHIAILMFPGRFSGTFRVGLHYFDIIRFFLRLNGTDFTSDLFAVVLHRRALVLSFKSFSWSTIFV